MSQKISGPRTAISVPARKLPSKSSESGARKSPSFEPGKSTTGGRSLSRGIPGLNGNDMSFLVRRGFDPVAFQGLQQQIRDGVLTPRSSIFKGELAPPTKSDVTALPASGTAEAKRLAAIGEAALRKGEVAVVVLAGGMATRFGGGVKGAVDVLPGASFIQLKLEDARQNAKKYGAQVPFCLMTSFATDEGIREHLKSRGLEGKDVHLFEQRASVRMTRDGEVYIGKDGHPSFYAPGHGDFFDAFKSSGLRDELANKGVKVVLFSNVDNLGASIDPRVIGLHLEQGADMTAEVSPRLEGDKAGCPVRADGRLRLMEGFRLPDDTDFAKYPDVSINSFAFSIDALGKDIPLVNHVVEKKVDGDTVLQLERVTCEATEATDGQGKPVLTLACVSVPREGAPGAFFDGRFYPVKAPSDLKDVADKLRLTRVLDAFKAKFPEARGQVALHKAQGRISLFGNFTDLGGGAGVTAALSKGLAGAFQKTDDGQVKIYSEQLPVPADFPVDSLPKNPDPSDWATYVAHSVRVLRDYAAEKGVKLSGLRGYFTSDLPVGSGMSSSAALEILVIKALAQANGLKLTPKEIADLAQKAESAIAPTGKLDQYAIAFAEDGKVNLFNAKQESSESFDANITGFSWSQVFTEPRSLAVGARYPKRKEELLAGRDALRKLLGKPDLEIADVTPAELDRVKGQISDPNVRKRVEHLIHDHVRSMQIAKEILPSGDVARLGKVMAEADRSYHELLEVGTPMMKAVSDATAELRAENPGLQLFAAASGGGDGGPVNLFGPSDKLEAYTKEVIRRVEQKTGKRGTLYDVAFANGLSEFDATVG